MNKWKTFSTLFCSFFFYGLRIVVCQGQIGYSHGEIACSRNCFVLQGGRGKGQSSRNWTRWWHFLCFGSASAELQWLQERKTSSWSMGLRPFARRCVALNQHQVHTCPALWLAARVALCFPAFPCLFLSCQSRNKETPHANRLPLKATRLLTVGEDWRPSGVTASEKSWGANHFTLFFFHLKTHRYPFAWQSSVTLTQIQWQLGTFRLLERCFWCTSQGCLENNNVWFEEASRHIASGCNK